MLGLEGSWLSTLWLLLTPNLVSFQQQNLTSSFREGGISLPPLQGWPQGQAGQSEPSLSRQFPRCKEPRFCTRDHQAWSPWSSLLESGRKATLRGRLHHNGITEPLNLAVPEASPSSGLFN